MQKNKIVKDENLSELITQYYDFQMSDYERIYFEAKMALSKDIRELTNKNCYEYFKISNSIKLVKNRCSSKAQRFVDIFERKNALIIYFNSVCFKGFYEHLRNIFLNILRHNSK